MGSPMASRNASFALLFTGPRVEAYMPKKANPLQHAKI
jgi:hypothetical protein